jgi:hypothetical protein
MPSYQATWLNFLESGPQKGPLLLVLFLVLRADYPSGAPPVFLCALLCQRIAASASLVTCDE